MARCVPTRGVCGCGWPPEDDVPATRADVWWSQCCPWVLGGGPGAAFPRAVPLQEELRPRLCCMKKGPNGYGFNLHSDKSRPGQYVRAVDPDSPAEASGLAPQDRIVEVRRGRRSLPKKLGAPHVSVPRREVSFSGTVSPASAVTHGTATRPVPACRSPPRVQPAGAAPRRAGAGH